MMSNVAIAVGIMIAAAAPVEAQPMVRGGRASVEAAALETAPIDAACPPKSPATTPCAPLAQGSLADPSASKGTADLKCPPEHAAMGRCVDPDPPRTGPSATALSGPENAADTVWGVDTMTPIRNSVYSEHGSMKVGKLMLDRFEYTAPNGRDGYSWEGQAWYGGDYDRLWFKTMGDGAFGKSTNSAELQALWSHAIDPWFNLQAGVRYDIQPRPNRTYLVVGVQGLAAYMFDIDVSAFLSDRGDLSARIEAENDLRITNRLIVQPRVELNLAAQDVRSIGVGAGLSSIEAGFRLRYEVVPEFAPYVGVDYQRVTGVGAALARAEGRDVGGPAFVAGIRSWF